MTTSSIKLEYRLMPCGCFTVSLNGLPVCHTVDPILDTALFLKEAGVAEEATVTMILEGSNIALRYSLRDVISEFECEAEASDKPDEGPQFRVH